ncbi:hypothetical protein J4476_03675 [Candidatus Woesearchaeota archaeon]|nr:MAG: hypothetical protein QT09_C0007G0004 [archaeon GW2011_AR18]MBS3161767.1 hypothetical protein [Candidatus Woesearchaeota archaeon]HIH25332.1 hypothetical protein [Nanoarchaeota archaeon]
MSDNDILTIMSKNVTAEQTRERARVRLADNLLLYMFLLLNVTLIGVIFLLYSEKIEVDSAVNIILAISTVFSGLIGSAITYYFSQK